MSPRFSDSCLSCCFNTRNRRVPDGREEAEAEPRCLVRRFFIEEPSVTHCANHPLRYPRRLETPVGPVYRTDPFGQRTIWRLSADTDEIRLQLLRLLEEVPEEPRPEYPFGTPFDETLIWQLGEFQERRAVEGLRRIARFDANRSDPVFGLNRFLTIRRSLEALAKILGEREQSTLGQDRAHT